MLDQFLVSPVHYSALGHTLIALLKLNSFKFLAFAVVPLIYYCSPNRVKFILSTIVPKFHLDNPGPEKFVGFNIVHLAHYISYVSL